MNVKSFVLLGIAFLFVYATCNKRLDCHNAVYSFEAFFGVASDNDSIQLNDTIFLELNSPVILKDIVSGQNVDYSHAVNFGTDISFDKFLDNSGNIQYCASCFELELINGTFVPDDLLPERNKDYRFEEKNGEYVFKLAIIPKQKGTFSLGVGNAVNVYTSKNKCDKANFSLTFKNTNQHLYLYEQRRPGYSPSLYERTHMYFFKVY